MNVYSEQDTLPHPCLQECVADAKYKEMTQRQPPTLLSLIGRPTKPNDPHPKIYALRRGEQQQSKPNARNKRSGREIYQQKGNARHTTIVAWWQQYHYYS
jgi:hypothetical protein